MGALMESNWRFPVNWFGFFRAFLYVDKLEGGALEYFGMDRPLEFAISVSNSPTSSTGTFKPSSDIGSSLWWPGCSQLYNPPFPFPSCLQERPDFLARTWEDSKEPLENKISRFTYKIRDWSRRVFGSNAWRACMECKFGWHNFVAVTYPTWKQS